MLGAPDVVANQLRRRVRVTLAQVGDELSVLGVGARQHLLRVGDQGDEIAHLRLDLGHLGDEVAGVGGGREADVEADVGAPVGVELGVGGHPLDPARRARRGRSRSARSAARIAEPTSIATRWSSTAQASSPSGSAASSRSASGGRSATKVPPVRPRTEFRWPDLDQGRDRLAQGRPRDPQLVGEPSLGRQLGAGGEQAGADRRPQPLDGLLEGGGRANRFEHRLDRTIALHRSTVTRSGGVPSR